MHSAETLFRTMVDVPEWSVPMQPEERFVLLGSCFAQNIGEWFLSYALKAVCNPLGVCYNPRSIATQVHQALTGEAALPVFEHEGRWHCWWTGHAHHWAEDEAACRAQSGEAFASLGQELRAADVLFITLGTSVCYRLKENGMVVANCHKMPSRCFEEVALSVAECTEALEEMMEDVERHCPKARVVFTVSPYRYAKYGFHGSQLAKSTLLLAVDAVCHRFPKRASYFPAYEIVLDELRDYRFYADDMIHPSPAAIAYIWQRLKESGMSPEMQQHLRSYEPTRRAQNHRPL